MTDEQVDYEDLTGMQLTDDELAELVGGGGECIFNWTTKDGYPVGVVVAYVFHDGKFFTTCAERRKRVPALRSRPQSAIVINRGGKTATYKGDSTVHASGDTGWDDLKQWFYSTLSGADARPDDTYRQAFRKFLDSPHRVIIETDVQLVVGFDAHKFQQFTNEAIAAGHAD
ncbi:MAG: hypothetical protein AAFY28_16935 [Actinomycetota bacterium]